MTTHPTVTAFAAALEAHDADAIEALLAPNAVLHSPLTDAFTFDGRWAVATVFRSAFELFSSERVHDVIGADDAWVIIVRGATGRGDFEEAQVLRLDGDGAVRDVTLIGRPVPALMDVMGRIGGAMRRQGLMAPAAAYASAGLRPIAAVLGAVERHVMPHLKPRTRRAAPETVSARH